MKRFTPLKATILIVGAALVLAYQQFQAQTSAELVTRAEAWAQASKADDALKGFQEAEKLDPTNVHILVSIARQYRHLMAGAETVPEKLKLGGSALEYGKKAALLGPKDSDAQLSTAITYGKMLPYLDKKAQVEASPKIKAGADRAIELNPLNDSAWHVLGRWHQSLANVSGVKRKLGEALYGKMPIGTNAESLACFEKAIAINPTRLRHYIEKGRTHAQMEQNAIAKELIGKGLAMPDKEQDDPEVKLRGRETLATLR